MARKRSSANDLAIRPDHMRSVVLAACQGERFIDEQLRSITAQLAQEDEIVVCDDVSTDTTIDVVLRMKDSRIRIFANEIRLGYIRNFERAISFAKGDTIYFSDQDDVWLPNKIAAMESALQRKPCVASDAIVVNEDLSLMHESYFTWRGTRGFSAAEMFFKPAIIGATLACKRAYLNTVMPFPGGVPHDFWLTVNAAWDDAFGVVTEPLILYRRHKAAVSPSGTSRRRSWRTIFTERTRVAAALISRRLLRYRGPSA